MDKNVTIWNDNLSSNNYKMFFDEIDESKPDRIILNKKEDDKNKPVEKWNFEIIDKTYVDTADKALQDQIDTKAPINHASSATDYGIGDTINYGHVKVINNLNQTSHVVGNVLSSYQGNVLNRKIENNAVRITKNETSIETNTTAITDLQTDVQNINNTLPSLVFDGTLANDLTIKKDGDKRVVFQGEDGVDKANIRVTSNGAIVISSSAQLIYLRPSGDSSSAGEVTVDNNVMVVKNLRASADLRVLQDAYVTRNLTVDGNLTVAGTTLSSLISRIEAIEAQI